MTNFGDDSTKPPVLPCYRDDAIVDKGAVAPKLCLSPMEMRTLIVVGGLLPASTASIETRTIFHQLPLCFCPTKEMNSRTSTQFVTTSYNSFWKVLETNLRQTLLFDPGCCTGCLRNCSFLGGRHALRIGWACLDAEMVAEAGHHCSVRISPSNMQRVPPSQKRAAA